MAPGPANPLRRHAQPRARTGLLLLALGLSACGGDERGPYPIEAGRERDRPLHPVPPGPSNSERLAGKPDLVWTTPPGWQELAAPSMSLAAFRVPGEGGGTAGDVTLSVARGTLTDNVNRWRKQMGQTEASDEAVAGLPVHPLFGARAVRVDLRGQYTAMGADAPLAGRRMLGLILEREPQSLFVKFVGPEALVDANVAAFDRFAASIRAADDEEPRARVPRDPPPAPPEPPRGLDPQRLKWDRPEGWRESKPTRQFRLVDFRIDAAPGAESYLSLLQGTGGGILPNVNVWRAQLGAAGLDEAGVAALERLDVLGTKAVFVEVEGDSQSMAGERIAGARFYGVIVPLESDTLFLRLVGPRAEVEPLREAFRALAKSLRLEG